MPYINHTDEDRREMLAALGIDSEEELFSPIPSSILVRDELGLGPGKTEPETVGRFASLASRNDPAGGKICFLGGGVYDHYVPSVVNHLALRSEFYTAYTPYQAEVSQGTLQAIFEFQTHVARLTALPVANASMYDGATALAEAALMAMKATKRGKVIVPGNLNPRYMRVLETYINGREGRELVVAPFEESGRVDGSALEGLLDADTAGVVIQNPNYFGVLEKPWEIAGAAKDNGSLLIASVDPLSLAVVRPPGEYDADIAVGEGQGLGNDMNFGGPLLGFMACKQRFIRQMPGRIVSRTRDTEGRDAYVLVLQTREQHIRRERATSNICTNEGLLALRAAIYLALLGEEGLRGLALHCAEKAKRLAAMLGELDGFKLRFGAPFLREFVVECPKGAEDIARRARAEGVLAGIPLGRYFGDWARGCLLVAVTEKRTEEDMQRLADVLAEAAKE
jgi:glycine dehydrogenase subunit 1